MKTETTSKAVARYAKKAAPALKKAGTMFTPMNILLFGVGSAALYFAVKGFKGLITKTPEEVAQDQLDQAIIDQQNAGVALSYPLTQYNVFADMLEEATDTAFTDEEAVYSVFRQLKNNADVLQLVKAYGERRHFEFGIPLGSYTLPQILVAVLDSGEIQEVRNILVSNGISTIIV